MLMLHCWSLSAHCVVLFQADTKAEHVQGSVHVANNVSFVPLGAVPLSLLEGGSNGIDDTATQFAEVWFDLKFGEVEEGNQEVWQK